MQNKDYEQKISILDWGIVISSILLLLTVYLPQIIWKEEVRYRKEGRHRMTAIANAEEFYMEMTGGYTTDGEHLFKLVEAAMDSLIADTLFTGEKIIYLKGNAYPVNMDRGVETRIDTTFSEPTELYFSYDDTVYTIGMKNPESDGTDTLFVNVKDLAKYQSDKYFQGIYGLDIVTTKNYDYLTEFERSIILRKLKIFDYYLMRKIFSFVISKYHLPIQARPQSIDWVFIYFSTKP